MRGLGVLVLLGACTSLLDLKPTVGDRDHDGVADELDDCPDDYDPQQADVDGDGIGDACGPCHAITHDLDGDGRDDACDACIGPGPTGLDVDHDGIDDGCDPCIDGVGQTGSDLDGDGIDDGCDPCIASHIDRDQDGIDDACDACLFGPPHDEDGDGIDDGCDDCPADVDPDQQRAGDEVGAVCDPDVATGDTRRLFDPFSVDQIDVWAQDPDWVVVDDALRPSLAAASRVSFIEVRNNFVVRTQLRFDPGAPGTLGFKAASGFPVSFTATCTLSHQGVLRSDAGPAPGSVDTTDAVELRMVATSGSGVRVVCEAFDHHGGSVMVASGTAGVNEMTISLLASKGPGVFEWIDAIDRP